ncbi:cell division protein FtsZ [Aequorivita lipolytica]|uniref:Cell division protein FtsZ n=1 Tax=Aequorivita lipolytica TaxID=153267 RepID=A0A5C6YV21_9FLAO|nr:cell division protein FtsZ [Aequorivita lipolytica]TXD70887.1 cell division protein FtsZ [Aequorivita lipolytica]SRX49941.1 Cell division protein FtsZ [Aequorivita lipolytica]
MSSKTEFENISFDLPKNQSNVIKVIGVGGGGSNAINHMFSQGIKGVDFVICNTDSQALENSPVPNKIQLGVSLTEGLGAGANPKVGEQSAVESMEEIRSMLTTNTKMIFITAGMGGGTGTGAAPIIAKMAKDMDILTVGIVTIPFQFEGKTRNEQAHIGVEKLRQNVDSLVVINNNKLREVYGNLGFKAGFSKADEVLATAARGIAEVITHHYTQNIDLRDAKTVLANSGTAIMGSATASGANRAKEAIGRALDSPLLNDNKIKGAKNVLLLIVSGTDEITIDEIGEISDHIQNEAGHSANIIMGVGEEESLEGSISITVIATGFNFEQQNEIVNTETKKIIHTLEDEQKAEHDLTPKTTATAVRLPENPLPSQLKSDTSAITHTLFDEAEVEEKLPFDGYIKTSELLKNIGVSYEEVEVKNIEEFNQVEVNKINVNEFVIIEAPKKQEADKVNTPKIAFEDTDEQILMFDLPINSASKKSAEKEKKDENVIFDLGQIEVQDHVEIVPITEVSGEGIKRYSLDDYQEVENRLNSAKPSKLTAEEVEDEEIVFEKRTVSEPNVKQKDSRELDDPMNSPIAKILSDRTEERKRKMKEFNYKFKNSPSRIDEIEKQPAYKRMGIDLNETKEQSNISRTSVNTEDDDIELRKNNSFLHDNVD